jgi:transposase-like protein
MKREIRLRAQRKFSADYWIRIVIAGLRGDASIAELCRRLEDCLLTCAKVLGPGAALQ